MIAMTTTRIFGAGLAAVALMMTAACRTPSPKVYTQVAPEFEATRYQTYGFLERPEGETEGYRTLNTGYVRDAISRQMEARGYRVATTPDLLVNFNIETRDTLDGGGGGVRPSVSVGVGGGSGGWRGGYGVGIGVGGGGTRTTTEGSLTVDLVDRERNALVWSGTASGRVTDAVRENPQPAITNAVNDIFAKYPQQPVAGGSLQSSPQP